MYVLRGMLIVMVCARCVAAQTINPYPRELIAVEPLAEWNFAHNAQGWTAGHEATVAAQDGVLHIQSTGNDPYLFSPAVQGTGPVSVSLRMRSQTDGPGQIFWSTTDAPGCDEGRSAHFPLVHDNAWHEYTVALAVRGSLKRLRLDPGIAPGWIEIAWIRVQQQNWHPLELEQLTVSGCDIVARLRNHGPEPVDFAAGTNHFTLAGNATMSVPFTARGDTPFETFIAVIQPRNLPLIQRRVRLYHPGVKGDWLTHQSGALRLRVTRDGSGAVVEVDAKPVAVIAPLVSCDGVAPRLQPVRGSADVNLRGDGVSIALSLTKDEVTVNITSRQPCEGPALRALGALQQGLLAGLEYLGRGEQSSSTLDIETPEHVRFAPDPLKVTMPLMAAVTEAGTVALTWQDMALQPVYAAPNFFDGTPDHRMALRGTNIAATILVRRPGPLEETILWAVKKNGLPQVPRPPRSREAQLKLCRDALNGPLKSAEGWGHCAEPSWARHPFSDFASTLWRLTGEAPALPTLAPGGSHIRNDAIYFVTGRAQEWLAGKKAQAAQVMQGQQADGSWRYDGPYRRGHSENTSSGLCAQQAEVLLEYARITGDQPALAAGTKALDFIAQHFQDPRGAQTWECPLHTPDILASAHLVWAFTRGYELTGKKAYLDQARRWALGGMPFVYLWGRYPIMPYATIAVYGATNWQAPNWMGLPVQWCGYVYAYALTLLAPHDRTLDWTQLARGILVAAEQMQCPDGPQAGCEPDSFALATQHRNGPMINPCALVSLRLVLDGDLDSIAVANDGRHRVVAPFPVTIRAGRAHIRARQGVTYQALVDGQRIVNVASRGDDEVAVAGP